MTRNLKKDGKETFWLEKVAIVVAVRRRDDLKDEKRKKRLISYFERSVKRKMRRVFTGVQKDVNDLWIAKTGTRDKKKLLFSVACTYILSTSKEAPYDYICANALGVPTREACGFLGKDLKTYAIQDLKREIKVLRDVEEVLVIDFDYLTMARQYYLSHEIEPSFDPGPVFVIMGLQKPHILKMKLNIRGKAKMGEKSLSISTGEQDRQQAKWQREIESVLPRVGEHDPVERERYGGKRGFLFRIKKPGMDKDRTHMAILNKLARNRELMEEMASLRVVDCFMIDAAILGQRPFLRKGKKTLDDFVEKRKTLAERLGYVPKERLRV